ncbi:MAG TPA: Ldh family oxidoreductase [Stellaceae bacterium]|nr:Ldh family oxidoreductase [Stellaceae bacterium]
MSQTVSIGELTDLVVRVFRRHGVSGENAGPVAETVVAAERDGALSHGLLRLPGYVSTLQSGWVDGRAVPIVVDAAPGLVVTEAASGFAQPALRASAPLLRQKARRQGIAAAAIRNSHHFAAVWPDIEPFAAEGFIALAMVNGRQRMAVWGGKRKLFGTSPMAFACPRPGTLPLVWDQASSVMAQGEILLAAHRGEILPEGVGLDADGRPATDPRAVLDGGSILPFGGHKGSSIAFMIEILAGALTGGPFGFEDRSREYPGAQTPKAGQTVILIDPLLVPDNRYFERIESLFEAIAGSGVERLPAERRYSRRKQALRDGIPVSDCDWATIQNLLA